MIQKPLFDGVQGQSFLNIYDAAFSWLLSTVTYFCE